LSPPPSFAQTVSTPLREARRKPLSAHATLTCQAGILSVRMLDVSPGALSVTAQIKLPTDMPCTVDLLLPMPGGAGRRVVLHAVVTNCVLGSKGYRLGLRFTTVSPDAQNALADFMKN